MLKDKQQNPQNLPRLNKRYITKLKMKERNSKKNTRASKSVRKFVVQREEGWNDSFVHDRIPTAVEPIATSSNHLYKNKLDTHSSFYLTHFSRKTPSQTKFRIKRSGSPQNLFSVRSVPNHYLLNRKLLSNVSLDQAIQSLQYDISKLYEIKQIPACHINLIKAICLKLKTKEQQIHLLHKELKQIKSPQSCIFGIRLLCQGRENCLTTIKSIIEVLKIDQTDYLNKIEYLKQHINDLRTLGLSCVQKILKWKQIISALMTPLEEKLNIKFSYCSQDEGNYLIKMFEDTKFIYQSKIFNESIFPDPFLLSYIPDEEFSIEMKKYFKIRACELLLLEQSLGAG